MADPRLKHVAKRDDKVNHRSLIFRTLIEIVKSYDPLRKEVKLWVEGNGSEQDNLPFSLGVLPAVRFRPYTVQLQETFQNRRRISFGVYLDVFTPGTHFDDLMNLWEAIEDSVVNDRTLPDGVTVYNKLHGLFNCRGPEQVIIQQEPFRDLTTNNQIVARTGAGHIMLPFNKDS